MTAFAANSACATTSEVDAMAADPVYTRERMSVLLRALNREMKLLAVALGYCFPVYSLSLLLLCVSRSRRTTY